MRDSKAFDPGFPFGPGFFLTQLRAFARDRCPDPAEGLPSAEVHLATGEALEVCHVIGLAERYVALAVRDRDGESTSPGMRTEMVAYALISRVTLRSHPRNSGHVGFDVGHLPALFATEETPEVLLGRAAGARGATSQHPELPLTGAAGVPPSEGSSA